MGGIFPFGEGGHLDPPERSLGHFIFSETLRGQVLTNVLKGFKTHLTTSWFRKNRISISMG
jgi:hypothetical protein